MSRLNRSSIPLMLLSGSRSRGITAPLLSPQWQLLAPILIKVPGHPTRVLVLPLLYVQSFVRTYFTKWQAAVSKLCTLSTRPAEATSNSQTGTILLSIVGMFMCMYWMYVSLALEM